MASNWVKLNVGGQLFDTTLTTLSSCPNSLLAKMFDPESGFEPAYNKDGVYFLDADPKYFAVILNWLRYKAIMVDSDIDVGNVAKVADYFGLEQLVKEIREIGAVLIKLESSWSRIPGVELEYSSSLFRSCLGLYLKQTDNSYRQAGGELHLHQASDGVWYVSDTLTKKDGRLRNNTSTESNILPRTDWQYQDEDEKWWDVNLKIIDIKEFTFCNEITLSSTKHLKSKFLGKFGRMSEDWLNGWPVYKNKEGNYLGVNSGGFWGTDIDENIVDTSDDIHVNKVTSCPAQAEDGTWKYWDVGQGKWTDDETFKIECDVHK